MGKLKNVSMFSLEGRFVGFIDEFKEKPKRIRLATSGGERWIKLSKELRGSLSETLQPGDWIQVSGEQNLKKTGELKLKAYQVTLSAPTQQQSAISEDAQNSPKTLPPSPHPPRSASCVMVCQKSSCCKRGAREVSQALAESLRDRGLADQVVIKETGCMKQCKHGPCMVFMPDKSRYTGVEPKEIPMLIEKHFAAKLNP